MSRRTETEEIIAWLDRNRNEKCIEGMRRFGINVSEACGVSMPALRKKARDYRLRHEVAMELWETGIHEARIMASLIADPERMDSKIADHWVAAFDSWDLCDQCCLNLIGNLPFAKDRIEPYAEDGREFVRRAAFVIIAVLAVHGKSIQEQDFICWLSLIEKYSGDERNFVKKAVNWALRQIGKRSLTLNSAAVETARVLARSDDKTSRWIGTDALRELTSERTLAFIMNHRIR